jgi:hypothetical protein
VENISIINPASPNRKTSQKFLALFILVLALVFAQSAIAAEDSGLQFVDPGPDPEHALSSVAEGAKPFVPSIPDEFVPGDMLIKFKEGATPDHPDLSGLKHEFDVEHVHTHDKIGVHLFRLKAIKDKADTLKAIKKYQKHPLVEFAEPNGLIATKKRYLV